MPSLEIEDSKKTLGLKLWTGGKAINCLIHSNSLEELVLVYNRDYYIQHCTIVENALAGGYAFTSGYLEPETLGKQDALNIKIQNSIFAFNGGENPTGLWISNSKRFTSQNSIYFSKDYEEIYFDDITESTTREQIDSGLLGTNFGVDPEFVNLENNDFHLKDTSLAIDNGIAIPIDVDLDYRLRPSKDGYDIGCYELPLYKLLKPSLLLLPLQLFQL